MPITPEYGAAGWTWSSWAYLVIPSAELPQEKLVCRTAALKHMNFMGFNQTLSLFGKLTGMLGSIDASRQTKIVNRYLIALFERYLNGGLAMASESEFPEVAILNKLD